MTNTYNQDGPEPIACWYVTSQWRPVLLVNTMNIKGGRKLDYLHMHFIGVRDRTVATTT